MLFQLNGFWPSRNVGTLLIKPTVETADFSGAAGHHNV